jgi:hypothetical protein
LHKIAQNIQIRQNSNPKIFKVVGSNPLAPYIVVNGRLKRMQQQLDEQQTQNNG